MEDTKQRIRIGRQHKYSLPALTKLLPLTEEMTILQSTIPVIPVKQKNWEIRQFACKSTPNCLAVVSSDTILLGSHSGKAKIYKLDFSTDSLVQLYSSGKPVINANNYCKDMALLPDQRFLLAGAHEFVTSSYSLQKPNVEVIDVFKHGFDFIAAMKTRHDQVLMACLSKECVVWSAEYNTPVYKIDTRDDPQAVEFLNDRIFAYGGYGSTKVSFCDIRVKRKIFESTYGMGTKVTCMKSSDNLFLTGTNGGGQQLLTTDLRHFSHPVQYCKLQEEPRDICSSQEGILVAGQSGWLTLLQFD